MSDAYSLVYVGHRNRHSIAFITHGKMSRGCKPCLQRCMCLYELLDVVGVAKEF